MTCDTGQTGFTLIELLVTIALLSLLLVLLFGGLTFGTRAWDRSQAHGAGTDELRNVQDIVRREIGEAYPRYDLRDPGHPVVDFQGGSDWVSFLAPAPQALQSAGRFTVTIAGQRAGADLQLAMQGVPELGTDGGGAWSTALLRHVAAVRISYFSAGAWHGAWTRAAMLPELVRVHVDFPPGDGRMWPDLIVAPRIEAAVDCFYDTATKTCGGTP